MIINNKKFIKFLIFILVVFLLYIINNYKIKIKEIIISIGKLKKNIFIMKPDEKDTYIILRDKDGNYMSFGEDVGKKKL